jgi:hypothetical protein
MCSTRLVREVHVRALRAVIVLAILAGAVPAVANSAVVTIDAVQKPNAVTRADVVDKIPRYRLFFGTKATLTGLVKRDDGQPAAGVVVTILRQIADATDPAGFKTKTVGTVTTDAEGRFERAVKPDRITYYYGQVEPVPELGVAAQTKSPRVGLLVAAKVVQTSDPKQTGAVFRVTGRVMIPGSRSLGKVVVERLKGQAARQVANATPSATGGFSLKLRHTKNGTYRYRLSFRPSDATRLISSSLVFSITVTAITPPGGTPPPQ